jgi:aminoglycoside phosphotransferase (APT) family kinase protein
MIGRVQMHADEVAIDAPLVQRLVRGQFPEWADLPLARVAESGTDNVTFRLGEELAVRLPRLSGSTTRQDKELRWLPRLEGSLPLPIPAVRGVGRPAEGYPFAWAVYGWLPGETATPERIGDLQQLSADLAGLIGALQSLDATDGPPPGQHNAYRGVPLALRDEATRAAIATLGATADPSLLGTWEAALGEPDWEHAPVWIHGDLDARNLLAARGRLCAVIDFGCLGVGDPACDVMVAWKLLDARTREDFRARLDVDDATWARARGWVLSQAVMALSYYTLDTNPILVGEATRWLEQVLLDTTG